MATGNGMTMRQKQVNLALSGLACSLAQTAVPLPLIPTLTLTLSLLTLSLTLTLTLTLTRMQVQPVETTMIRQQLTPKGEKIPNISQMVRAHCAFKPILPTGILVSNPMP